MPYVDEGKQTFRALIPFNSSSDNLKRPRDTQSPHENAHGTNNRSIRGAAILKSIGRGIQFTLKIGELPIKMRSYDYVRVPNQSRLSS